MKLRNFSNYEIDIERGLVINRFGRVIGAETSNGYVKVRLKGDDGKKYFHLVHRLVATAAYGEIPQGMVVNHLDGCKHNNSAFNLQITSQQGNLTYADAQQKRVKNTHLNAYNKGKQVAVYENGMLIGVFTSTAEAAKHYGYSQSGVACACRGVFKTYKKKVWVYSDNPTLFLAE